VLLVVVKGHDGGDVVLVVGRPEPWHRCQNLALASKVNDLVLDQSKAEHSLDLIAGDISQIMRKGKDRPAQSA
jgi:hypothetical protein